MRTNFPGSRKTWVLAALVASGLLLVQAGALPLWLWGVVAALVLATQVLAHADRYRDELFVSDEGLSRQHGSRLRKVLSESVRWDELAKVEVLSNETGAGRKEMLFLLYGRGGQGVAVPGSVARSHDLVAVLEGRLPGFRKEAVAQAEQSAERRSWTLWEANPP